eukprot:scaffold90634_cov33-Tisochrysis_lutea.AAC.4
MHSGWRFYLEHTTFCTLGFIAWQRGSRLALQRERCPLNAIELVWWHAGELGSTYYESAHKFGLAWMSPGGPAAN